MHIPARVQIKLPSKEPWSSTAAPYVDWSKDDAFPLNEVADNWGLNDDPKQPTETPEAATADVAATIDNDGDEIPFG